MVNSLAGKRALITGAASGIGKAAALALHSAGANVIGLDLTTHGDAFEILHCDLSVEESVAAAMRQAAARLGGLDILVNNAGVMEEAPLGAISAAHVDRMFAVNVRGAIFTAREALPHLPDGGRIVNVVSELAYIGRANASVYCATKAALLALTRSWARELAPRILVNAVAPGPTDTPLLGFETMDRRMREMETANPLGRIGRPEEVAAAIVFLAGPSASLFVGQCIGPNCGAVMF
ncbi:3-oxoacyl-[acyl-carrier protein] reductase [Rhizobium leguminosarum]|uniref:3-oxoacyl-[acyl-carrier protein] reductase n=1 Tax=Rhizobium leguminosarum TaxID=384 RepID=A0AAE2T0L2_RHILE|nr:MULTISPECIES: SDR family oxidoreductase [Rhizobium]ARM90800.1 3-oxoacyl-(acyl-carrier-protein) reductase protein [Rhizobium sp. CIAT894]MBB4293728.1 3-oxoacyl-[acyl-carrier protein] reductase [Rhizobium leguminosarum]MBB4310827.1 3-oxoacyl-[acyl-carrier protein] reductase [Rhizobium leguminosarum]MBB4532125.1 3-oxoacyl-[acyl-carrier protein] reductase [Rhizobium leguminosarum]MDF9821748.1 3-oxoacyl-[acyl-carrier protein] reductase [Rhizobium leguminosarum]